MGKGKVYFILVVNLILWSVLGWFYYRLNFYDKYYITLQDLNAGSREVTFYSYPLFDSSRVITDKFVFYINPPFYYDYRDYYKLPPELNNLRKIVFLTDFSLLKYKKVREFFWKENIEEVYLPYYFTNAGYWKDFMEIIQRKEVKLRFYFAREKLKKGGCWIKFIYPFYGQRSLYGGFIIQFSSDYKMCFFNKVKKLDWEKLEKNLSLFQVNGVLLPQNGNVDWKPKYHPLFFVYEDLSSPYGSLKIPQYFSFLKKGIKLYRISKFEKGIKLYIGKNKREKIVGF